MYRCTPLGEDKTHNFSVLTNPTGDQMVPVLVIPPNCPDPPYTPAAGCGATASTRARDSSRDRATTATRQR